METIKPLSEAVQSMVRSGFIISCLTTVVEELIYNSLDAGATKVSVSVAVNNGYVKVEDDGFGISRDGLVLLGERYATSKLQHFHEKDSCVGNFGFRGEVLCSIADISLVEIVTRVQGRPNGYRKVMKGRKCLCLSIDNDRHDVGTTVIVRDLFYNQPVRRRQMQCSAKKVLHSVKKCAVRIALVQPKVSFKVIDLESGDDMLYTRSCSSPLSLLCSNFGIEASSLHELSFSEGSLKLTGYVSALSSSFASKAVQYIYVNSRFVVKGPIHKVLNRLADMGYDQLRGDRGEKRSQAPAGPLYCLNLTCPRYSYGLNLEFSRASVEFKDWAPVLAFIEKSVTSLWSEERKRGICHDHEADHIRKDGIEKVVEMSSSVEKDWWLKTCEMSKKRRRTQNSEDHHACTKDSLEMQVDDFNLFLWKNNCRPHMNSESITVKFRESETERESPHRINFTVLEDGSHSKCNFNDKDGMGSGLFESDEELASRDSSRSDIFTIQRESDYVKNCLSSSRWKDQVSLDDPYAGSRDIGSICSPEFIPVNDLMMANDDQGELSLQNCSWENPLQTPLNFDKESQFQIDNVKAKRHCSNFHGSGDAHSLCQNFDIFQRDQSCDEIVNTWPLLKFNIGSHTREDIDIVRKECDVPSPFRGRSFDKEYPLVSPSKGGRVLFPSSSTNCGQQSAIAYPFADWDSDNIIPNEGFQRRSGASNSDGFENFNHETEKSYCRSFGDRCSNKNFTFTSRLNSTPYFTCKISGVEKGVWESSPHGQNVDKISSIRCGNPLFEEIYSPSMDRRCRDSSVCLSPLISPNKGIQMDLQGCQEFGQDNILMGRPGRNYDSSDSLFTARCELMVANGTSSPCLDFQSNSSSYKPSVCCFSPVTADRGPKPNPQRYQVFEPNHCDLESESSGRPRRSLSAPPFCRGRKRFHSVKSSIISTTKRSALQTAPRVCIFSERDKSQHPHRPAQSSSVNHWHDGIRSGEESLFYVEQMVKETSKTIQVSACSQDGRTESPFFSSGYLKEVQDSGSSQTKWREGCPDSRLKEIANYLRAGDRLNGPRNENEILDIQSCLLDLAGNSLVPKSIKRSGLENAKVLSQIDSKFIPVVASGTLVVLDQHAADERIQLEEMRQQVLSGEMKSISYLEKEKDLVLPEMAYQLLCEYAGHIKHWGWICNIFEDSGSFAKNLNLLNERPSHLTLTAVPCILGVIFNDADLVEYLEQLADTDGSSTIPPSVVRVLNYKACRGAIMFGDKLLPSECSLIVEELKRTSLCFQCAHGRPTTVPLVNLKALHKAILQLGSWREHSENTWHGLCRKEINLDRAKRRLDVARGCE
ncbi:hypothetical protein BVRB_6g135740 [Beta vulgaris subsp. vulgaris]|nr:hypothetical protein BVRB_6g135740 [Beta vulgaris subsp. vulgaris]